MLLFFFNLERMKEWFARLPKVTAFPMGRKVLKALLKKSWVVRN